MVSLSNVVLLLSAASESLAFSSIPSATRLLGTQLAAMAPLDQELESWASSAGYGKIDKAIPA
eukprot:scaffold19952_cov105-Skeletonema_marinoi.AAC.4